MDHRADPCLYPGIIRVTVSLKSRSKQDRDRTGCGGGGGGTCFTALVPGGGCSRGGGVGRRVPFHSSSFFLAW